MTDGIWKRQEIESPCVKICVVHPQARLCVGCLRSIDEIGAWSSMTPEDRRRIMAELPDRKTLLRAPENRPSAARAARRAARDRNA